MIEANLKTVDKTGLECVPTIWIGNDSEHKCTVIGMKMLTGNIC